MRWTKVASYLREHPYLLDPQYNISVNQAETLIEKLGHQTFAQMIEAAKARAGLPASAWTEIDAVIAASIRIPVWRKYLQRCPTWSSRGLRWVIVSIVLAIMIGFFTLIPTGRSLAQAFFDMVIRTVENIVIFEDTHSAEQTSVEYDYVPSLVLDEAWVDQQIETDDQATASALQQFRTATKVGRIVFAPDFATLQAAYYYENADTSLTLSSVYGLNDRDTIVVIDQRWYPHSIQPETMSAFTKGARTYEREFLNNIPITCIVDQKNETVTGVAFINQQTVLITFPMSIEEEVILKNITIETSPTA